MRKKTETLEEYFARGGKVTIIPTVDREEEQHTLPVKTSIDFDSISLGDAEYMFGESRSRKSKTPKKRVSSEEFSKMVEASGLPLSVIEALKKSTRK